MTAILRRLKRYTAEALTTIYDHVGALFNEVALADFLAERRSGWIAVEQAVRGYLDM